MADETTAPDALGQSWPYAAHAPQRYTVNLDRYLARGGKVRLASDVQGFVHDGRNTGDMARFYFFCLVFDQLVKEGLAGDIAELGVYKGDTATLLANVARQLNKTTYLLDTFEGFNENDLKGVDSSIKMEFGDTSIGAVRALVGDTNVKYVKGYFPDTAAQLPRDATYCLVHIDCDLYAPMMSSLEYFYPRLVPGGYLLMHDYTSLHWGGAERAIDEFFADKPESPLALPDGAGTAVVRKTKQPDPFGNWLTRRRSGLLDGGWVVVSTPAFEDMLGAGWSQVEPWGVWGVGKAHEIEVILPRPDVRALRIEAEVSTVLLGPRTSQQIDVISDECVIETWSFSLTNNLALRHAEIPIGPVSGKNMQRVTFNFRPRSVATPVELDPAATDTRSLGLGLHRIRFSLLD